jgi:hypothetical protein
MTASLRRGGSAVAFSWNRDADPTAPKFSEALAAHRFRSIERAASEEVSVGWVTPGDATGDSFEAEDMCAGSAGWLRFRRDVKKLPAARLQMEIANAERARGKRLSARERRELKDHLHEQLLPGILPRTTLTDVLVSGDCRTALLLTSGASARDALGELTNGALQFYPTRLSAGELATRVHGDAVGKLQREVWPGGGPKQRTLALNGDFLGDEFLLWLWWQSEVDGGTFLLPAGREGGEDRLYRECGVVVHELVAFEAEDEATSLVLRHGLTTRAAEARAALREGRCPTKLRLLIAEGSREWFVTLDGSLAMGSVRLPDHPESKDEVTPLDLTYDRAEQWLRLWQIVEHLFDLFMQHRAGDGWGDRRAEIAAWMAGDGIDRVRVSMLDGGAS